MAQEGAQPGPEKFGRGAGAARAREDLTRRAADNGREDGVRVWVDLDERVEGCLRGRQPPVVAA